MKVLKQENNVRWICVEPSDKDQYVCIEKQIRFNKVIFVKKSKE